jgi:hypothetical protein
VRVLLLLGGSSGPRALKSICSLLPVALRCIRSLLVFPGGIAWSGRHFVSTTLVTTAFTFYFKRLPQGVHQAWNSHTSA